MLGTDPGALLHLVDLALREQRAEKPLVVQGSPGASTVRVGSERRDSAVNIAAAGQWIRSLDPRIYFGAAVLGGRSIARLRRSFADAKVGSRERFKCQSAEATPAGCYRNCFAGPKAGRGKPQQPQILIKSLQRKNANTPSGTLAEQQVAAPTTTTPELIPQSDRWWNCA